MMKKAQQFVKDADAMLVLAGAGMSADASLPTFRGKDGLWAHTPAAKAAGVTSFQELANPKWFDKDAPLAWGFYGKRKLDYDNAKPHEGYSALLKMAQAMPQGYRVLTTNVDGLFQKAGFENVTEVHGSIHGLQNMCGKKVFDYPENWQPEFDEDGRMVADLPRDKFMDVARPTVLMFNDFFWAGSAFENREKEAMMWFREQHTNGHKVVFVLVGAGDAIPTLQNYARELSWSTDSLVRVDPQEQAMWVSEKNVSQFAQVTAGAKDGLVALAEGVL